MIDLIQNNLKDILAILTALVTICSILSNFTKTDSDNKVVAVLSKINDIIALNLNEPKKPQ